MNKDYKPSKTLALWIDEIDTYDRKFQDWDKRSKEIIKRFRDERPSNDKRSKFNILWSNVQTLSPALYSTPPTVNIDRRFQDDDDLGRYSSLVLERAASYYVGNDVFDDIMKQSVLDRLLSGRGTAWVRYVPVFEEATAVTEDAESEEVEQDLYSEDVIPDYVFWRDFGHTVARTWQEVRAVWRIVYMDRSALVKRFGEIGQKVPLDAKREDQPKEEQGKKATIYEIWDKTKKKAIWLHKSMEDVLDERDDPLGLKNFFPCPKPVYATLTNDCLIPVPDYIQYQDQARELDTLTGRIDSITKALKVCGVYAADAQGLDALLSENTENKLIPVDQWAAFAEKGGLAGVFSLMPLTEIINTLKSLFEARDKVKNDLYEITGISDVIRGATKASETATAQQLKGQYAGLRLDHQQKDIARYARDIVRIMTEIIAEHFSMDTIKQVSGIKLLTEEEKTMLQQQMQMMQPSPPIEGQPQQPPPELPPELKDKLELLKLPSWEEIEAVIRDDTARCFRIDIETDSTIKTDQEAEKAARVEFLTAASQFIGQAVQVPNPELQPLLMEMLMFGIRGFKVSRELETTFDNVLDDIKKQADAPKPPPQPDPEVQKAQAQRQLENSKMQQQGQLKTQELQAKTQAEQQSAILSKQTEYAKLQNQQAIETMKIEASIRIKEMELQAQAQIEEMKLNSDLQIEQMKAANERQENAKNVVPFVEENDNEKFMKILEAIRAPKTIIRDENGDIVGVE